jgi:type IV secretory pathway TrbL component
MRGEPTPRAGDRRVPPRAAPSAVIALASASAEHLTSGSGTFDIELARRLEGERDAAHAAADAIAAVRARALRMGG